MKPDRNAVQLARPAPSVFSALLLAAVLTGCGIGGPGTAVQRNSAGTRAVALSDTGGQDSAETAEADVQGSGKAVGDAGAVVEIKEKMFIAQTNDVYLNPEDYMGKTIKLEGLFKSYDSTDYGVSYCFVIRYGPGCCGNDGSAGFEVAWDRESRDEEDAPESSYPEEDAWVEAAGVLKSYEEDGFPYLYLSLSSLTVKEERGAEFVAQ
ncbi:MAG: hypothetical protein LBF74_06970 [Treponema sp.]|jgi:uncharacterized membrane protein YcgQ (UPF0703/DUF1980 family)|nr:hypothetical protein [Treponema sp.]